MSTGLSTAAVRRAHRFLLEIHAARSVDQLRVLIPAALGRLISGDRASFNEIEIGAHCRIAPTPVPSWWGKFGDIYSQHLQDHPLWNQAGRPRVHRVVSLSDARHVGRWSKSALYHEYFVPLGVSDQLSTLIHREGNRSIGIAVNRSKRDFDDMERAVLRFLSAHVGQAWRTANLLQELAAGAREPGQAPRSGVIAVDPRSGKTRALTPDADALLQGHFAATASGRARLPEDVLRWVRHQQAWLAASEPGLPAPEPLLRRSEGRCAVVRLAQQTREDVLLVIEDRATGAPERATEPAGLTARERQILRWLRDGKRNSEIGMILGISARTVGKHLEHLFLKLGVETRTAAGRLAADWELGDA